MFKIKIRVIVGVMIFLGYFMIYVLRYDISVHIVDMTTRLSVLHSINVSAVPRINSLHNPVHLFWDDMRIATIMSAYYIGYVICFPIFHNLGDRLGPTWVVFTAGMVSGILHCLSPAAAHADFWLLFIVRTVNGFCAGAMQPNMVQVLRYWVPPVERNYFMWAYCGVTMGTFSTLMLCALVQYYSRWSVGFYINGGAQILWCMLWVCLVTDHPRQHAYISIDELNYLINTIGNVFTIKLMNTNAPWNLIIKSIPFWNLCILNFGYTWFLISLCLHGTIYYYRALRYPIYFAAMLTAAPFFFRFILGTIAIHIYHWRDYKNSQMNHINKYFIVISHVIPGILICSTWFAASSPNPYLMTIAYSMTAAGMDLTFNLCYALTPNYVNSIHTVLKIIGNIPGIISSYCVGAFVEKYENSPAAWKHVWCFHAAVLCVTGLIFIIWGETRIQPWNSIRHKPRRPYRAIPKPSIMSNITEVDEDDNAVELLLFDDTDGLMRHYVFTFGKLSRNRSRQSSHSQVKRSIFNPGAFRMSMAKV